MVGEATEEEIEKYDRRLWVPPKGVVPAPGSPWSAEKETEAFQGFAAAFKTLGTG